MTALRVLLQNDVHGEVNAFFIYDFCSDYLKDLICVETYFVMLEKHIYNCPAIIVNKICMRYFCIC